MTLEEIEISDETYPSDTSITTFVRNPIYQIPSEMMPDLQTYQIEVKDFL